MEDNDRYIGTLRTDCLAIEWRERGGVTILALHGKLLAGSSHKSFDELVDTLVSGQKSVVLTFKSLRKIDSRGIGSVVDAAVKLKNRVAVVAISKQISSLLAICKLSTVLPQFDSEEEAIQTLTSAAFHGG